MTLAKTGSRITDQLARASKANQAKEAAAKSKAAKAAKAAKAGSRGRKIKAGRNAIKSGRGRGIAAQVQKSGSGFGGLLNYAIDKPEAQIVASNCGFEKDAILKDMMRCASLRKIKNAVGHITFSVAPDTVLSNEKWRELVDFAREEIELDDSHSYIAVRHHDADHDHIHIVFCRVSDQGQIHNDYSLGIQMAGLEDLIEDKFNLPLRPVDRSKINFKKGEVEKSLSSNIQPERMQLNQIVMHASTGKPSVTEFIARCAQGGVVVRPNIASTGKLNGFAFSLVDSGVEFKGSKIGCGWSQLQKIGVHYEQDAEASALANLSRQLEQGQRTSDSDQSTPEGIRDLGATVQEQDRPAEQADRTAQVTDRSAQVTSEGTRTASPDPVLSIADPIVRPGVARTQPAITSDQVEPPALDRIEFEAIKADLIATNGSAEARQRAAVSMNWSQQAELKQIVKNIDAWHKRMGQAVAAAPAVQGDAHISLPSM